LNALTRADMALSRIDGIRRAAAGKPLTRRQSDDYYDAFAEYRSAASELPSGGNNGDYIDRLYDSYRSAAKAGTDVMDRASAEKRDLTAEEAAQVNDAFEDVDSYYRQIKRATDTRDLGTAGDAFRASAERFTEGPRGRTTGIPSMRDLFRRVLDTGHIGLDLPVTVSPTMTLRALQSAGGSAIETSFSDLLTIYERSLTPMLDARVVTVAQVADGSPRIYPTVTADPSAGGTVTAEAAGITELDATLSQVTLNPYKYGITNLYSAEIAQDAHIRLEDTLAFTAARELSVDIGAHLTTGDGSNKPNGFINAATNGGTAAGTGTTYGAYFGPTDLVSLFYSLPSPYRENGSWQANATSIAQIRNSRTTVGEHIWQPAVSADAPETLLGRPIYENPAMANGSAAKSVAFGDFSRYQVLRVNPRVEISIHYKFNLDQIALRSIERVDGDLLDAAAIRYLVGAAV
jgi:HK97 family phage major capsid protein